ncbi:hypothetical protein [Longispora albida]|uniref:hypothetical protein n=1 Tax=Longispora albida TaxID=203523 RepID=UPI0003631906|nr:hypothetical protein [Longispora albida]
MNRTKLEQWIPSDASPSSGEVLVATQIEHPVRGQMACPAADLVGASLRRHGLSVSYGAIVAGGPGGPGAEAGIVSYLDRDGSPSGLGAVPCPGDPHSRRLVAEVMNGWSAVLRTRRLILDTTPAVCTGQQEVLRLVDEVAAPGTYVAGPSGTDPGTQDDLQRQGVVFGADPGDVPAGATLVIPASGIDPGSAERAARRGLRIVDGTCPWVRRAQDEVRFRHADHDELIVVIGPEDVRCRSSILSQAARTVPVSRPADVAGLRPADPAAVSYVVTPGCSVEAILPVIAALRARFPALRGPHPDGWCYAATDRLLAIRAAVAFADLVLVCGAAGSADAQRVARVAGERGARVELISAAGDIRPEWLAGASTVAILRSVSASPGLPEAVCAALHGLGPASTVRRGVASMPGPAGRLPAQPLNVMPARTVCG